MALFLVTAASGDPISLQEAKTQIRRNDVEDDDELISKALIPAVTDRAQHETQRQLLEATWDLKLDAFPCWEIEVPRPPLISVLSITYVDTDGVTQTLATSEYRVSTPIGPHCRRGRVTPAYGKTWPSTRSQIDAVIVRFKAGYGTNAEDVPALLRQGMLMDVERLYDDSSAPLSESVAAIYRQFQSYGC